MNETIKKHLILILVVFSILILSGCGSLGMQKGNPDQPNGIGLYTPSGTEGLTLEFLADQPPAQVYTTAPLLFMIKVKNAGTYDLPAASLHLTGYDQSIVNINNGGYQQVFNLEGKSQFNPEGGMEIVEFESNALHLPLGAQTYNPTFLLTACYKYKTRANPVVCLDTNPTDKLSDKVCNPNGASPGSQGAPIAVSSIEQETTPKATYFRIQISNAGGGVAFDANSIGSCPHLLDYKELNKIRYYVPTLGEGQAFGECKPDHDKLRLVNGQATIFCKFPHSQQQGAYQTTLNIELEYGYKNSISQQVDIRSIDE